MSASLLAGLLMPFPSALDALHRYPPVEGRIEKRRDHAGSSSFDVWLCDPSGSVCINFREQAADAFRESPALHEGKLVRLEGYELVHAQETSAQTGRRYELLISSVHSNVQVISLDLAPAPELMPLAAIDRVVAGQLVNIDAIVHYIGKLEQKELRHQPGSYAPMRALVLRQASAACSLVLWGREAKACHPELMGRRVFVQGTRVTEFRGKRHLSGWGRLELR